MSTTTLNQPSRFRLSGSHLLAIALLLLTAAAAYYLNSKPSKRAGEELARAIEREAAALADATALALATHALTNQITDAFQAQPLTATLASGVTYTATKADMAVVAQTFVASLSATEVATLRHINEAELNALIGKSVGAALLASRCKAFGLDCDKATRFWQQRRDEISQQYLSQNRPDLWLACSVVLTHLDLMLRFCCNLDNLDN